MIKKGFTLIEILAAMVIMVMCLGLIVPMIHTTGLIWNKTSADKTNKELLTQALLKMDPYLRDALKVDTTNSSTHKLVLIMPLADSTTKSYVYPLQNGDSVAFYLSNKTGSSSGAGTILWKSLNGTPNSNWSLRSSKGAIDFTNSNMSFNFDNAADPSMVTITVYSTQYVNGKPVSATDSTSVLLRNHQLGGL